MGTDPAERAQICDGVIGHRKRMNEPTWRREMSDKALANQLAGVPWRHIPVGNRHRSMRLTADHPAARPSSAQAHHGSCCIVDRRDGAAGFRAPPPTRKDTVVGWTVRPYGRGKPDERVVVE